MPRDNTLYEEWEEFHKANPKVYELVCHYAQQVINRGLEEYAIATIWERLRWHLTIETHSETDFKLPNNHRAYYARLWLDEHPDYPKFFRTCMLRSLSQSPRDRWGRDFDDI